MDCRENTRERKRIMFFVITVFIQGWMYLIKIYIGFIYLKF